MINLITSLILAYIIGSIPTSFIFGKLLKKIDIRKQGSGNVGATNVFRVVGKIPAILVLLLDMLKGALPVLFLSEVFFNNTIGVTLGLNLYKILLGACAISGHVWSVFLRFKGGKGVATTAGVLLALAPNVLLAGLTVWIVTFSIFRIVSIASIASSMFLPVAGIMFAQPISNILFYVFLCIMGAYKHKANIRRLLRGQEKKLLLFLLLSFILTSSVSAGNLYDRFKNKPEIRIYLKEVTSEVKHEHVNTSDFRDVFEGVLPKRVNISFKEARNAAGADAVVTAKIKKFTFDKNAIPIFFSVWAPLADLTAPKSAALLSVDYTITHPRDNSLLAEFKAFTTNERRPKEDMIGVKGFRHAANKNINRFIYRAFYKQRRKRPFAH